MRVSNKEELGIDCLRARNASKTLWTKRLLKKRRV